MKLTRAEFLKSAAAAATWLAVRSANANPLGLPLGIQLYTVRKDLASDFPGVLHKLAAMGYVEVEGGMTDDNKIDFNGGEPGHVRQMLSDAGLHIPSCHFGSPRDDSAWGRSIEAAQQLGLQYMLCAGPPHGTNSLDAWKKTAGFLNHLGDQCKKAGMQFAYHNHNHEFRVYDGVVAYDELLRSTDANLVKMEMDCFWTTFAGKNPIAYFQKYPGRFPLLHIKDLKPGFQPTTGDFKGNPFCEVGDGVIKWAPIFEAAKQGGLKHYFVEQDQWDRPSLESARMSAEYLKNLNVS